MDFERLTALYDEAARLGTPQEVEAFLDRMCADSPDLRLEVLSLLTSRDRSAGFLDAPVFPPEVRVPSEAIGDEIDGYRLLSKLGEGGCGVVYEAEQQFPVRRIVALKVIRSGMDTRSVVARFDAERQALSRMDHPNVARIFDAGVTLAGSPYFAMELVRGVRITEHCRAQEMSVPDRLRLFIQVCDGIQHAHHKGVIHRDIKPANILVTMRDSAAVPKVIDFGIAKAVEGRLTDRTLFTLRDQFIGTPAYMSPEQ
ncbi:MAG: serine/threonine protein kinase, partial [Verrucomicrobiales bacterium]|nr:serine/threonine protein kinase [Verrucomicrobiales bacterium]